MVNQKAISQPKVHHQQHWVRRFGHIANLVFSLGFAVVSGFSIGWYYSTLDSVSKYQWVITYIIAVVFSGFGFFLSRGLAYCMHHKDVNKGVFVVVVLGLVFYEIVELSACFTQAAFGIKSSMVWVDTGFNPMLSAVLHALPFVVLPIFPVFTILCGQLDIVFDIQNNEVAAPAVQPPVTSGVAPLPTAQSPLPTAATRYKPSSAPQHVPSANAYGTVPFQNGSRPQSPAPQPASPVAGSVPGPNETRIIPDLQPSAGRTLSPVTTTPLGSDDETLVTRSQELEQPKGGNWLSRIPLVGRKPKEPEAEYSPIPV